MALALVEIGRKPRENQYNSQGRLERILNLQTRFEHDLLTNFPEEGISLDPDFIRHGIDRIIDQYTPIPEDEQSEPANTPQVLKSSAHPYVFFMRESKGNRYDLRYLRPTKEAILSHPDLNFPFEIAEGIGVINGRLNLWLRTDQTSLPKITPLLTNDINHKHSDTMKYAAAFAKWALDPNNPLYKKP